MLLRASEIERLKSQEKAAGVGTCLLQSVRRSCGELAGTLVLGVAITAGVGVSTAVAEERLKEVPVAIEVVEAQDIPQVKDDQAQDDEDIVISASLIETDKSKVGSSVTVFTKEDLQRMQKATVLEVLKTAPGLDVVQTGGVGGNTSIFLRGTNSEHTLVLLDGIELNDPSSSNRAFNFADFTVDGIERIEIVRGSQSTLYGGDAIGGVIQIFTTKGEGKPKVTFSAEGGSFGTYRVRSSATAGSDRGGISLSASQYETDGVSAADSRDGNSEDDGYENQTFTARGDFKAADWIEFSAVGRYIDAEAELDNFGGAFGDDPNRVLDNRTIAGKLAADLYLLDDRIHQQFSVQYTDHQREDNNDPDPANDTLLRSNFDGELLTFRFQNDFEANDEHTLTLGAERQEEKASSLFDSRSALGGDFIDEFSEQSAHTDSVFFQDLITLGDNFNTTVGARYDNNSQFGNQWTWRVAPVYTVEGTGTTIRGSAGTGFKAPSLVQLQSSFGNPDLEAEESLSFDAGFEQVLWDDRLQFGSTVFWNEIDDLITFDPNTFSLMNIAEARTYGVESSASFQVTDAVQVSGNHTYTRTEDKGTDQRLLRRPTNKFNAAVDVDVTEDLHTRAEVTYIGSRADNDFSAFPAERVRLSSYTLFNLAVNYKLCPSTELFARGENLGDKKYQEVLGFGTRGIAGYGGVRVSF